MNTKALTQFLSELSQNNEKAWFDANKKRYDALRSEWLELIEAVIVGVAGFDSSVQNLEPKQCTFRINRDIRFSKDKSPYKTNFSMVIVPEGKKTAAPAYYMHLDAKSELFIAGGVWMPEKEPLTAIRANIAEHPERIESVLKNKALKAVFGDIDRSNTLTRLPKGYEEDVPHPDLIKLKSFTVQHSMKWKSANDNTLEQELVRYFEAMHPLIVWLREAQRG
ncbi:MAG: DUF2461 domain-containing protein [Candidatus Kapabacteria bacterium]|jgi:uncharacterized protein (TIGR02453 family)|nr:DUF2461 domain-containing protein [Candidatus Kapabacteria bacterium]